VKEKLFGVFRNKMVIIPLIVIVLLFIIAFPHTKRSHVEGQLAGIYTVVKERYLFHRLTEVETINVCNGTVTTRVSVVEYRFDGSVKSVMTENCDTTGNTFVYHNNGALKESTAVTLVGNQYRTVDTTYTEFGQIITQVTRIGGTVTEETNIYDPDNFLVKNTIITNTFGVKTREEVTDYDQGDVTGGTLTEYVKGETSSETVMTYDEEKKEYTIVIDDTALDEEATFVCGSNDECVLEEFDTDTFRLEYDDLTDTYELTDKSDNSTQTLAVSTIYIWSYDNELDDIREDALDAIN
jgi:antitoxin component YwqK of YwqJK toxin-antitoxin module